MNAPERKGVFTKLRRGNCNQEL